MKTINQYGVRELPKEDEIVAIDWQGHEIYKGEAIRFIDGEIVLADDILDYLDTHWGEGANSMNLTAIDMYELDDLDNHQQTDEPTEWTINDLDSANWALRKMNAIEKKLAETNQLAEAEIKRIKKWQQTENEKDESSYQFFKQKLSEYLLELRQTDPKATIKTPYGRVSTRKTSARVTYTDTSIEELKMLGLSDYIRITEEVKVAELKKHLTITDDGKVVTDDGQLLEQVIVIPAKEDVTVKVVD